MFVLCVLSRETENENANADRVPSQSAQADHCPIKPKSTHNHTQFVKSFERIKHRWKRKKNYLQTKFIFTGFLWFFHFFSLDLFLNSLCHYRKKILIRTQLMNASWSIENIAKFQFNTRKFVPFFKLSTFLVLIHDRHEGRKVQACVFILAIKKIPLHRCWLYFVLNLCKAKLVRIHKYG